MNMVCLSLTRRYKFSQFINTGAERKNVVDLKVIARLRAIAVSGFREVELAFFKAEHAADVGDLRCRQTIGSGNLFGSLELGIFKALPFDGLQCTVEISRRHAVIISATARSFNLSII